MIKITSIEIKYLWSEFGPPIADSWTKEYYKSAQSTQFIRVDNHTHPVVDYTLIEFVRRKNNKQKKNELFIIYAFS